MNTHTLASHIVNGFYGRRQVRRAQRDRAELQRQHDFTAPRRWVLAHINTRADYKPGQLARMVAESQADRDMQRDWQQLLAESRLAYRTGRALRATN